MIGLWGSEIEPSNPSLPAARQNAKRNILEKALLQAARNSRLVACHNCCKFAVALYPDFYSLL